MQVGLMMSTGPVSAQPETIVDCVVETMVMHQSQNSISTWHAISMIAKNHSLLLPFGVIQFNIIMAY